MRGKTGRGAVRLGVFGGAVALVAAGSVPAFAAGAESYAFSFKDHVVPPGESSAVVLRPDTVDGMPNGTLVFAMSKAPLTDASWAGGGLPAGMSARLDDMCQASPTVKGVFLCRTGEDTGFVGPAVVASDAVKNLTKLHFGVAYAPRGADLKAAVKKAQLAQSAPVKGLVEPHSVTVLTADHVKKNVLGLKTPELPAGGTVTQSVTVQARDAGKLRVGFGAGRGQRQWDKGELNVEITSVKPGAGASNCTFTPGELTWDSGISCDVAARGGREVSVSYTLKAAETTPAWKLGAMAGYDVYTSGWAEGPQLKVEFGVKSPFPVKERYSLLARNKDGRLFLHAGTGDGKRVFEKGEDFGDAWKKYTLTAKLSPVKVQMAGGGVVARDAGGVLWNFALDGEGGLWEPLKVGAGWNVYDALTGAGDVTGDGKPDLLARDTNGTQWLYAGTGVPKKPFAPRVKIGAGWKVFDVLTGGADLTGDGRADLLARDKDGAQWLYAGTGVAAKPFAPRVQIGAAADWKGYTAFSLVGDLDSDLKVDLVARDASGVLHLLKGTGQAAAPFAPRVKIGGGWNVYGSLL
ncbi:VCBS repeat-containing protein [Streptomyces bambusae]|uniref:FG-GAP repeat domain-containing protein n=1 Tax=Streptomyces bambusae TaxID=1550616 RepID=UPI001CFEFD94|nr:VCBS repeat-containing protein [Streptomyces bambusae]MCB5166163.1 VCBS repeat-containing protein [Streptomyces bambusae]